MKIAKIHALEVLDSRAYPTIETEVVLDNGVKGRAMVPSGASTGKSEVRELRDGDTRRWIGKGVLTAVGNVNEQISKELHYANADVGEIDAKLRGIDGTPDKSRLGANAILSVSLAAANAIASANKLPLYRFIAKLSGTERTSLPTPMVNIISGGLHAGGNLDIQDFLVVPLGANSFRQALDWVGLVYHSMKQLLKEKGYSTLLADEGGFSPAIQKNEKALTLLSEAVNRTKLRLGLEGDAAIAVDVASSHFNTNGHYVLKTENRTLSSDGMIDMMEPWCDEFPIVSIEDACAEEDWNGWHNLTERLGSKVQLLGDDIFTTNVERISKGKSLKVGNAVLIKPNQIGTLSETIDAIALCKQIGYAPVISARSGETDDYFIADLAVGTASGQIKIGSIARSERTSKYNRLLRIEEEMVSEAAFTGKSCFPFLEQKKSVQ